MNKYRVVFKEIRYYSCDVLAKNKEDASFNALDIIDENPDMYHIVHEGDFDTYLIEKLQSETLIYT